MEAISGFFDDYFKNREFYKKELDRIKEETYYLVKFEYFDRSVNVNGIALLNEKDKEFFDNYPRENFYLVDTISECEKIEFTNYDFWKNCYSWQLISDEDRCTINILIGDRCGYFFYPEIEEE